MDDGLLAQQQIFSEASHDWSVMSSMMGPSFRFDLLRMTLPTEVAMVSMYTSPIVLSLTTWLELTLEMPGVIISPMDIVSMGVSWPTSTTSDVFRQVITLAKPPGRVGSQLNANALTGGGDASGNGAFDKQSSGLIGIVRVSCQALPLDFSIVDDWGISLMANTGQDGCSTFSHPAYFGAFFSGIGFGTGCASGTLVAPGISAVVVTSAVVGTMGQLSSFFGEVHSLKTSSSVKDR